MPQNSETILVHDDQGVRTITLNRPDVLNAFDEAMLTTLLKVLRQAEKDASVRCLVLTGAGRAFCSGQDLAEVRDRYERNETMDFGGLLRKRYNPVIDRLRNIEKPVVASVNGVAAGAGCSVALACDLRIAAESASFIQAFINVGLVPDAGSTFMLPRLVGVGRAMDLACTGRKVKSDEALRIGLINQVAPDDALADETTKLARRLAELPTRVIGLIKRAINVAWCSNLETHLDYEAMLQATAAQTNDHREGIMAFIEKRSPRFAGD